MKRRIIDSTKVLSFDKVQKMGNEPTNSIYIFSTPKTQKCIDVRKIVSVEYTENKKMIIRMLSTHSDFEIPDTPKSSYEDLISFWAKWAK